MDNNNEILQELKEMSPVLRQLKNKVPYTVPFFYFEVLPNTIVSKIITTEEPNLPFTQANPYTIPHNYFADLSSGILKRITRENGQSEIFEEMEEIAPLLNTVSKKPVYVVPERYFEKVHWSKNKKEEQKGELRFMTSGNKVLRYAAAAVIIGLLTCGLFLFLGKQGEDQRSVKANTVSEVKQLSEQEIVEFLKTNSSSDNIVSHKSSSNQKDTDIKSIVNKMSDKEIQRFLEEYGDQDEM